MGSLAGAGAVEMSVSSDEVGDGGEDNGDSADGAGDDFDDEGDDFGEGEAFGDADGASLAMAMPIMATKMSARTS